MQGEDERLNRMERTADAAHRRIDELDRRVTVQEHAVDRLHRDIQPIMKIPEMLATMGANLTHLSTSLQRLHDDLREVKREAHAAVQMAEKRQQNTIAHFVWPILMLIIGGVVGFFFRS